MKRCSYCGGEYPDEAVLCAIDHTVLDSDKPILAPPTPEPRILDGDQPAPEPETKNGAQSEDFRYLWKIDPAEATELLKQFVDAGIRFKIEQTLVSQRMHMFMGYPPMPKMNIYVHLDDKEKAMKILPADWKV